jgi:hypothetical protein
MAIDGPLPRAAPSNPLSQSAQTNASAESRRLESHTRAAAVQAREADGGPDRRRPRTAPWPAPPLSPRPGRRLPRAHILAGGYLESAS